MEIMQVHLVLHRIKPIVIRLAVPEARLHTAARKDGRKAMRIVVAAVIPLRNRSTPKLTADHNQRVLQHPAALQITNKPGNRLIHLCRIACMVLTQIAVLIPFIGMRHLYEAHALLRKPPGKQTLMPKIPRLRVIQAIQLFSCLSLTRYFLKLRSRQLHPIRKLKRTQPALKPRIRPRMAKLTLA